MSERFRLLGVIVTLVMLVLPLTSANAQEEGGNGCGGGCGEESTPGLIITAGNQQRDGAKLTLTAQTNKDASAHGNLVFRDDSIEIKGMDVHRVMLHEEPHNPDADETCGEAVRASVRGTAHLNNGETVRVRIDMQERGPEPYADRLRVRIRPYEAGHEPHDVVAAQQGECGAEWTYDTHWMNIHRLQIKQR